MLIDFILTLQTSYGNKYMIYQLAFKIQKMGNQVCCSTSPFNNQVTINFNDDQEPRETSAPNRLKKNNPHAILISRRGFQEGVDGDFITEDPLVTQTVFSKIQTLPPVEFHDVYFCERGKQIKRYFKFKRTGIVYFGEWKNGIPTGLGKNYYPNGGMYEGGFQDGIPHGYGRFIMPNGDYYQGQIKFGRANGVGTYQTDQSIYKGSFKDNLRHGHGEEKSQNLYFKGQFQYGSKLNGILKYQDNVYEGKFLDELYHGHGTLSTVEGQYEGEFKEGKQHGYGQFRWKNSSIYRGYYNMGVREGQGEYFSGKSSSISRGIWKNGKLNGEGVYIESRGGQNKCIWKEGKISAIVS